MGTVAGADTAGSPLTWLALVSASLALLGLIVAVGAVRCRPARSARWACLAPWLALPVGLVLLYVAFVALDSLLPASF